uniref:peptidylprolyl isomerase n=1 Tax=Anopheles atroparvus TaxID=41427 RepID=A0A240PJX4_ANOAO
MENNEGEQRTEKGNVLKTPISLGDLLNGGSGFQIDTEFRDNNRSEEVFMEDDYGSADEDEEEYKVLLTPWTRSFDELRQEMEQRSEFLYKRVIKKGVGEPLTGNKRVTIEYNGFFENEVKPFDSTTLRNTPFRFILGSAEVLPGLDDAVQTMCVSEEAQFLISYKLLFGEVGCPPRVKPKADGLFVIKLISFTDVGDADALSKLDSKERRSYAVVKEKVAEIRNYAKDCFKRNILPNAIHKYLEAIDTLLMCELKDEEEQKEQQATLVSLYTSLAVCYNRKEQPKDACRMVNEVRQICDINQHAKILYQEGKALHKLGEYDRSQKSLLRAQQLQPEDESIKKALKTLNASSQKHRQLEKSIWSRALGMVNTKQDEISDEQKKFIDGVRQSVNVFLEDDSCSIMPLPERLSQQELSIVQELADAFKLKLTVHLENNKKHYKFQKKP